MCISASTKQARTSVRILEFQGLCCFDGSFIAKLQMEASDDATRVNKKYFFLQVCNRKPVPRALLEVCAAPMSSPTLRGAARKSDLGLPSASSMAW